MVRSLWTAASGMTTQQKNVDTISNNLANINTTGYKKEKAEFKSLLYQTIQEETYNANGEPKPVGAQVGLGVKNSAVTTQFTQGSVNPTGNDFDFAIEGKGFFSLLTSSGEIGYTRNGSFRLANGVEGFTLTDSSGNPLLATNGMPIVIREEYIPFEIDEPEEGTSFNASKITVNDYGEILYPDKDGVARSIGMEIAIVQFNNPGGLLKVGNTMLKETGASGMPRLESDDPTLGKSKLHQGYLEASNVQAIDEMVDLIVAQRAYEMNSKVITATDEMMQQANNLR